MIRRFEVEFKRTIIQVSTKTVEIDIPEDSSVEYIEDEIFETVFPSDWDTVRTLSSSNKYKEVT